MANPRAVECKQAYGSEDAAAIDAMLPAGLDASAVVAASEIPWATCTRAPQLPGQESAFAGGRSSVIRLRETVPV